MKKSVVEPLIESELHPGEAVELLLMRGEYMRAPGPSRLRALSSFQSTVWSYAAAERFWR